MKPLALLFVLLLSACGPDVSPCCVLGAIECLNGVRNLCSATGGTPAMHPLTSYIDGGVSVNETCQ
jgi:hypothetical protein